MNQSVDEKSKDPSHPSRRHGPVVPGSLFESIAQAGTGRLALAVLLLTLAALALMPAMRGLASRVLVMPLLYLLWLLRILLDGIPQSFFWFLAVLFFIRTVKPSLSTGRRTVSPPSALESDQSGGRVTFWRNRLARMDAGHYSKWTIAQKLAKLTTEIFSHQGKVPSGEVRARLQRGEYDLPPKAAAFLELGLATQAPSAPSWWIRLRSLLERWRVGRVPPGKDRDLDALLRFLEEEMEVTHDLQDHRNRSCDEPDHRRSGESDRRQT